MKELTLEITDYCGLNCLQCSTEAGPHNDIFWKVSDVEKYLKAFPDFHTVRISGGEPFEHPKLEKILKKIKDYGRKTIVLSCGSKQKKPIPSEDIERIKPYLDEIVFSMHGFYDVHDGIVTSDSNPYRHPPYWDNMMDSLDEVILAGIDFSFQTVAMKQNLEYFDDIASSMWISAKSQNKDINWHILRYIKQGRGKLNEHEALSDEEQNELMSKLEIFKDNAAFIGYRVVRKDAQNNNFHGLMIASLYSTKNRLNITYTHSFDKDTCDCGKRKAVVTYNHEIIPCSALKNKKPDEYGNIACKYRL